MGDHQDVRRVFFFGKPYPGIVSVVVAGVFTLFIATPGSRCASSPSNYGQYRVYRDHMGMMRHEDTTLWWWQVVTGFAMFFLAVGAPLSDADAPGNDRAL